MNAILYLVLHRSLNVILVDLLLSKLVPREMLERGYVSFIDRIQMIIELLESFVIDLIGIFILIKVILVIRSIFKFTV